LHSVTEQWFTNGGKGTPSAGFTNLFEPQSYFMGTSTYVGHTVWYTSEITNLLSLPLVLYYYYWLMIIIYVKTLIILMISHNNYQQWFKKGGKRLFKNELCCVETRPAGASHGPCGCPGARGHRVGDPCPSGTLKACTGRLGKLLINRVWISTKWIVSVSEDLHTGSMNDSNHKWSARIS
jgi:hypothetical protein